MSATILRQCSFAQRIDSDMSLGRLFAPVQFDRCLHGWMGSGTMSDKRFVRPTQARVDSGCSFSWTVNSIVYSPSNRGGKGQEMRYSCDHHNLAIDLAPARGDTPGFSQPRLHFKGTIPSCRRHCCVQSRTNLLIFDWLVPHVYSFGCCAGATIPNVPLGIFYLLR